MATLQLTPSAYDSLGCEIYAIFDRLGLAKTSSIASNLVTASGSTACGPDTLHIRHVIVTNTSTGSFEGVMRLWIVTAAGTTRATCILSQPDLAGRHSTFATNHSITGLRVLNISPKSVLLAIKMDDGSSPIINAPLAT